MAAFGAEVGQVERDQFADPQAQVGEQGDAARLRAAVGPVSASAAASSASTSSGVSPTVAEWSRSTRGRSAPATGLAVDGAAA